MIDIKGVAHFSIPVSDMDRSQKFYTEVIGLRPLAMVGNGTMSFLDAGGVCVILCKQNTPIDQSAQGPNAVHHSFIVDRKTYSGLHQHLTSKGVRVEFEEDRQGGTVNGPRLYFRDPDGAALEFIDLTSYSGAPKKAAGRKAVARKPAARKKAATRRATVRKPSTRKAPLRRKASGGQRNQRRAKVR